MKLKPIIDNLPPHIKKRSELKGYFCLRCDWSQKLKIPWEWLDLRYG